MAGARAHGVVEHYQRERADRIPCLPEQMHLGDLLVEWTPVQVDPQRVHRGRRDLIAGGVPACGLVQTFRTRILVALVAQHAVVDLAQHLARRHTPVSQREPVAAPQPIIRADHPLRHLRPRALHIHEPPVVERLGKAEDHPRAIRVIVQARRAPALEAVDARACIGVAGPLAIHHCAPRTSHGELHVGVTLGCRGQPCDDLRDHGVVFRRRHDASARLHQREHPPSDEVHLEAEQVVLDPRGGRKNVNVRANLKEAGDEATHMRGHRDEEIR